MSSRLLMRPPCVGTYLLLPGAGGAGSYWDRVATHLRVRGHLVVAVDLPGPDPAAGLEEYAEIVAAAAGFDEVVLVAQSLGGFTAAMVANRLPLHSLVFVNAMIPVPGETPGEWWGATGAIEAREAAAARGGYGPFDVTTYFLHDVDVSDVPGDGHEEADAVFAGVCAFEEWPRVPIRVLVGADDRFFPAEFQCRIAQERLGVDADVLPGGHLIALARPSEVADCLGEP
jgi:pimeloyl-ACP methyl ester carboxylesterase